MLCGDFAGAHEFSQKLGRGRRKKLCGDFTPGHFGDHTIGCSRATFGVARDAFDAIAHQRQGEPQISGCLHQTNAAAQIEIRHRRFKQRLVRAVNQVEAVWHAGQRLGELVDCCFDPFETEACRAKKTEHAGAPHLFDYRSGRNTVGHRAGDVGVAQTVIFTKAAVAKIFGRQCGRKPCHRIVFRLSHTTVRRTRPSGIEMQDTAARNSKRLASVICVYQRQRRMQRRNRLRNPSLIGNQRRFATAPSRAGAEPGRPPCFTSRRGCR